VLHSRIVTSILKEPAMLSLSHQPVRLSILPDGRLHPRRVAWPERCRTHILIGEHLVAEYCLMKRFFESWEAAATVHITATCPLGIDAWRWVTGSGSSACAAVENLRAELAALDEEIGAQC
jgi:hypothetical protein